MCRIEVGSFLHGQIVSFVNEAMDKLWYDPNSVDMVVLMNILDGKTTVHNPAEDS